jgi:hypothetical protein
MAEFLPRAVAFVATLVVGLLVAKSVRKALGRLPYEAAGLVARLTSCAVLLVALHLAFGLWGPSPISALLAAVVGWLPRLFVALVLVLVAAAIARGAEGLVATALGGRSRGPLFASITSVLILGLGVVAALNEIGVATEVSTPVLIAVLATIGGVIVVGVGGGLIRPTPGRASPALPPAPRSRRRGVPAVSPQARSARRAAVVQRVEIEAAERPDTVLSLVPRAAAQHPK